MHLFLWTGPKHGGKTTCAARLAQAAKQHGFCVAGLLAPSIYQDGRLVGFDALDLRSGARSALAVRRDHPGDVGSFHFLEEGLRLGRHALDRDSTDGANLVIVDEFGPLELAWGPPTQNPRREAPLRVGALGTPSRGWRGAVDSLVHADRIPLVVVVRRELADAVREVYANVPCRLLDATAPESIDEILRSLREDAST